MFASSWIDETADGGSGEAGAKKGAAASSQPKQTTRNNNTSSTKKQKTKQKEGRQLEEPTLSPTHTVTHTVTASRVQHFHSSLVSRFVLVFLVLSELWLLASSVRSQ